MMHFLNSHGCRSLSRENETAILTLGAIIVVCPDPTTETHVHLVAAKNALVRVQDFLSASRMHQLCIVRIQEWLSST